MATGRPDWFGTIVSAGKYDTTFVPIAVDVDGNLVSLMKGTYDSVLKTIALDEDGVMLANLSAQDLDFLTVRPAYGGGVFVDADKVCPSGATTSISSITGRGVSYTAMLFWSAAATRKAVEVQVYADDSLIVGMDAETLLDWQSFQHTGYPLYLIEYDDENFQYAVGVLPRLTFESKLEFKATHSYGVDVTVKLRCCYALVP